MKLLCSIILVVIPLATVVGQSLPEYSEINVIPPSPNVAAFQKFTELPVSLYTGTPEVNIPLFEINMKQLSLPIALQYHASGLKVEEHASWVGAGWSLVGTGSISRTTRGLPDELSDLSLHKKGRFHNVRFYNSNGTFDFTKINTCDNTIDPPASPDPLSTADSLAQGFLDLEPDIFQYSFSGGSGKFAFTYNCKNGPCEIIKFVDDDVTIIDHPYDSSNIPNVGSTVPDYRWVIKTADGVKYTFEAAERTEVFSVCSNSLSQYSPTLEEFQNSWHLTEISHQGEWIRFNYANELIQYDLKFSESGRFELGGSSNTISKDCYNHTDVFAKRLSNITTSSGYSIDFMANTNRLDLSGSRRLDKIRIYKNGYPVKFFKLDYDYFGNNDKLKLEHINQTDENELDSLNGHSFTYYSNGNEFPPINSSKQDTYGYYNGSSSNGSSMIPPYKDDQYYINNLSTVSRAPSLFYARIGTLKQIQYPTGGTITFDYELHQHHDPDHKNTYFVEASATGTNTDTRNFVVAQNCSANLYVQSEESLYSFVEFRKWNGSSYQPHSLSLVPIGNRLSLPAGSYQLYAYNDGSMTTSIKIEYEQEEATDVSVGGLRIKNIQYLDPTTNQGYEKHYEYTIEGQSISSGKLFSENVRGYITTYQEGTMGTDGLVCFPGALNTYFNISTFSALPLSVYQGSHVGYSEVDEFTTSIHGNSKDLGYTQYNFVNDVDHTPSSYPFVNKADLGYKNGKPLTTTVYKNDLGTFKKVRKIVNLYGDSTLSQSLRGLNYKAHATNFCYECDLTNYSYNEYAIYPKWYQLIQTNTIEYDHAEAAVSQQSVEFDYLSKTDHNLPVAKHMIDSKGDDHMESYTRDSNYPALVTEIKKYLNPGTVSERLVQGNKFTYHGKLPGSFSTWDTDGNQWIYDRTIDYVNNNIREIIVSPNLSFSGGDLRTSYVYGYSDSYPVVECSNITYPNLATHVSAAINDLPAYSNGLDDLDNLLSEVENNNWMLWDNFNDNLRVRLSDHLYTTYTYKPGVGIYSVTDSNGITQHYSYDKFNRLIETRDNDKNLIQTYEYHYKNQD